MSGGADDVRARLPADPAVDPPRRATVLVTGMSAVGKSTVLDELARRGHAVVDTDAEPGWIEDVVVPGQDEPEPLWREDRVRDLLEQHRSGLLAVAGTVANQGRLYPLFDAVVLLSAPADVVAERLETRTTNPFGKQPDERAKALADLEWVEPLLRAGATVEIDTRAPLDDVVAAVLAAAGLRP